MPGERRYGMDHGLYQWSPLVERPKLVWPDGRTVAVCILVNLEYFELDPPAGSYQAADITGGLGIRPYPNIPRLSHREYGHRVGVFRILDALARRNIAPIVAMDAMTAEQYPYLVTACRDAGAELVCHGIAVTRMITSLMTNEEETSYIRESLDRLAAVTGSMPLGWYGPERGESTRTLALLSEQGVHYVCDWCNDEQPYRFTVPGSPLYSLPTQLEVDDVFALSKRGISIADYGAMLCDTIDELVSDGANSGRLLVLNLHPWLIGQPFRIGALEEALDYFNATGKIWWATGQQVVDWYATRDVAGTKLRDP